MTKIKTVKMVIGCALITTFALHNATVVDANAEALTATAGISTELYRVRERVLKEEEIKLKKISSEKVHREVDMTGVGVSAELLKAASEEVHMDIKDQTEDQIKEEPEPDPIRVEDVEESGTIYVGSTGVNLRQEPNPNGALITAIDGGTQLTIIGHYRKWLNDQLLSDWTKIDYNGQIGYVCSEYLTTESPLIDLGQYQITYYCPCAQCCDVANRQTASGTWPEPGRTIATDPSIPFGTRLIIDGHEYIVEDRGGAIKGNHIDLFVATHSEALQKGVHYTEVYMVR